MPKRSLGKLEELIIKDHWLAFGRWVCLRRHYARFSQEEAAKLAGFTLRHWIRIESGESAVPRKRIADVAKGISTPIGKVMIKAGYEESNKDLDTKGYFKNILGALVDDDLGGAVAILFQLYHRLEEGDGRRLKLLVYGTTAQEFATAAVLLARLPTWVRSELVTYIKAAEENDKAHDFPSTPQLRREVRMELLEKLKQELSRGY
jgi:transcriptional regulator with XRE-family HTH domain